MCAAQFGQRYVEEQDDKTVTEWMDKQVRGPGACTHAQSGSIACTPTSRRGPALLQT